MNNLIFKIFKLDDKIMYYKKNIQCSIQVKEKIIKYCIDDIELALDAMYQSIKNRNKIL